MARQEQQHRIKINVGYSQPPGVPEAQAKLGATLYGAQCSCGWQGSAWRTEAMAERDGDEHVIAIT